MDRRNFLRRGSFAGLTISTGISGLKELTGKDSSSNPSFDNENKFDLDEITIGSLQQKMQRGEVTSVAITNMYLKRINSIDKNGPRLNAVIELNPNALKIAESLDKERKAGKLRGHLHGIPVLIKDNIDTGDLMMTTAGSIAMKGHHSLKDAFIIKQLREAGAVLLGKTNLSEWANFRSEDSTSGWSSRGGQTKCPYILDRNPSGSSSGSAVATAANLCAISIGTETNGSIISPSSINGLVGIKPTVGLWSRSGIIPISETQDTAGPMARTVMDAAILLGALTGIDEEDQSTTVSFGKTYRDYGGFLNINGLTGKRIGIEKQHLEGDNRITGLLKQATEDMKRKGAIIIEVDIRNSLKEASTGEFTVLLHEFKNGLNQYLQNSNGSMKSLQDIIFFNDSNKTRAMPYFKQDILIQSNEKGNIESKEYKDALIKVLSSRKIISELMNEHKLDALSGISNGTAGCIDLVNGDYNTGFYFSAPAAMAGFPHITVPAGQVFGLPVGISFFSTAFKEPELLAIAYSYEQATKHRKPPKFIPDLLK